MATATCVSPFRARLKHPEWLTPKRPIVPVKTKSFVVKLERSPIKVNSLSYTLERLVCRLNELEDLGEIIKSVSFSNWKLGCRMQDDIIGILAKGNVQVDLSHYV